MMSEEHEREVMEEPKAMAFSEFLESVPPSTWVSITTLARRAYVATDFVGWKLYMPDIQLHCSGDACYRKQFFRCKDKDDTNLGHGTIHLYMNYMCSNCQKTTKTFSLAVERDKDADSGRCYKIGEIPLYGPPTPPHLISLIGPDKDLFLRGRRCEDQGLGIGAFVYYRRVVENQKNRILDETIRVCRALEVDAELISILERAKIETRFSSALASVKEAIPQSLLINGHNPLTLLHSALSEGLHAQSDEDCLEIAGTVRDVLAMLSERLAQALKDKAEINNAVTKLMRRKSKD